MVEAICQEIKLRYNYLNDKNVTSIYFGGGTPSLMTDVELSQIFKHLTHFFNWESTAEITLETNPDDIDTARLKNWRSLGINRLSIGLQSFNDQELAWMNRAHTAAQSINSVKMAQDEGFNNITIDLIYGSKFQNAQTWEQTLQTAVNLNIQHISAYNLTIEDKTVLGVLKKRGMEPAVNEDLSSQQFLLMQNVLKSAGFVQYEVSNFGKPGFFAKHNSSYWLQQAYLGLGPSAHSFNGNSRQWNLKNNAAYIKEVSLNRNYFEKEELSIAERYNEYVLTGLRTIWGCDVKIIGELFGLKMAAHFIKQINKHQHLVTNKDDVYVLNSRGLLQADGIASDLFFI